MKNLLDKPLRAYIVFTCFVLACSIPAYFYLIETIWIDELDDHNQVVKNQLKMHLSKSTGSDLDAKIALWNQIQSTSKIMPVTSLRKDSVYTYDLQIIEGGVPEIERFRGLASSAVLGGNPYSIIIETNVEEVHETILAISLLTGLFVLMLIFGFVLLNRRLSRGIWRSFTNSLEKLKKFDLNSTGGIRFDYTDIREFAELNNALSTLIDNNLRLYRRQKEFAQNASHELQTPLALIKTKLDLLIQDSALTAKQRNLIENLENALLRVTRINKNLLVLAGIENKDFKSVNVDLSKVISELSESFRDFAENKQCNIFVNVSPGKTVSANESLVEILISNLISNAIRHTEPNSEIKVLLYEGLLIVTNEGANALEHENLYKRFGTVSNKNPGTGLGLAIVKEICNKYNWRVGYEFKTNRHVFSVYF